MPFLFISYLSLLPGKGIGQQLLARVAEVSPGSVLFCLSCTNRPRRALRCSSRRAPAFLCFSKQGLRPHEELNDRPRFSRQSFPSPHPHARENCTS